MNRLNVRRRLKSTCIGLIALILLCLAYTLGYHRGYAKASQGAMFPVLDAKDTMPQGPTKIEYDPYFTKDNPIPAQIK